MFNRGVPIVGRIEPELFARVIAVKEAAGEGIEVSDVVRDALIAILPVMEAQLGIEPPADEEAPEPPSPPVEDRTRGSAWGAPAV